MLLNLILNYSVLIFLASAAQLIEYENSGVKNVRDKSAEENYAATKFETEYPAKIEGAPKSALKYFSQRLNFENPRKTETIDPQRNARSKYVIYDNRSKHNPGLKAARVVNVSRNRRELNDATKQPDIFALKSEFEKHNFIENQNFEELKNEVSKLQKLVEVLRDQQYILSLLDDVDVKALISNKNSNKRNETSHKVKSQISNNNFLNDQAIAGEANDKEILFLKQEIEKLKRIVDESFKTATLAPLQNDKFERKLEIELQSQKEEIRSLKQLVEKLTHEDQIIKFSNSNKVNSKARESENESSISQKKQIKLLEEELIDLENRVSQFIHKPQESVFADPLAIKSNVSDHEEIVSAQNNESISQKDPLLATPLLITQPTIRTPLFQNYYQTLISKPNLTNPNHNKSRNLTASVPSYHQSFLRNAFDEDDNTKPSKITDERELEDLQKELDLLTRKGEIHENKKPQSRDSSSSIKKILKSLEKDDEVDADDSSEILKVLSKQMSKNKKKENNEQLKRLLKNIDQGDDFESKTSDNDDVEKRLIKLLSKNKVESKSFVDDDVDSELKLLQRAIEELQPKQNLDFDDNEGKANFDSSKNLQVMLNKLVSHQSGQNSGKHMSNSNRIQELKKQIMVLKNGYRQPQGGLGDYTNSNFGSYSNGHQSMIGTLYPPSGGDYYHKINTFQNFPQNQFGYSSPSNMGFDQRNNIGYSQTSGYGDAVGGNLAFGQLSQYDPIGSYNKNGYNQNKPNYNTGNNYAYGLNQAPSSNIYGLYPGNNPKMYSNSNSQYLNANAPLSNGYGPFPNQNNQPFINKGNVNQGIYNYPHVSSGMNYNHENYKSPMSKTNVYNSVPAKSYGNGNLDGSYPGSHSTPSYSAQSSAYNSGIQNKPSYALTNKNQNAYNADGSYSAPSVGYNAGSYSTQNKPTNQEFGGYNMASNNNQDPNSVYGQFFQGSAASQEYKQIPQESYRPGKNIDAANIPQSHPYPSQVAGPSESYTQQKVYDLKSQIYNLQNVINNLNRPEYTQKPEDKQTVYKLEEQINDLKNVINRLSPDNTPAYTNGANPDSYKSKTSSEYQPPVPVNYPPEPLSNAPPASSATAYASPSAPPESYQPENAANAASGKANENEGAKEVYPAPTQARTRFIRSEEEDNTDLDQLASVFENHFLGDDTHSEEDSNAIPKTSVRHSSSDLDRNKQTLQEKLVDLQKQLESKLNAGALHPQVKSAPSFNAYEAYQPYYGPPNPPNYQLNYQIPQKTDIFDKGKSSSKKAKKLDVFDKLFAKILDKVIDKAHVAIPKLIKAFFGIDFNEQDDGYGGMQNFRGFGLFGFMPMLILKLLSHLSSVVNQLQRNKFVKTFLVPALIVGGVAGLVIFLIWWLQPSDNYGNEYVNNYGGNYANSYAGSYGNSYRNNDEFNNNNNYIPTHFYQHNTANALNGNIHDVSLRKNPMTNKVE